VKLLRLWLLVLLAVLLPVRGAMAAAMLCPSAGMEMPAASAEMHTAMPTDVSTDMSTEMQAHDQQHPCHTEPLQDESTADASCQMCAAFCSITPLLPSVAVLAEPGDLRSTTFPDLSAPAPTFLSDGQERPPRSI
jgi:hypothetical protein